MTEEDAWVTSGIHLFDPKPALDIGHGVVVSDVRARCSDYFQAYSSLSDNKISYLHGPAPVHHIKVGIKLSIRLLFKGSASFDQENQEPKLTLLTVNGSFAIVAFGKVLGFQDSNALN
ncbi:hypothetical protein Anapl_03260 [Anas platyrhynchos]|uniref:Uncharacterized protein n=1 Tax=Anas platyrhynchos TaxID=8839 RepID=R0LGK8_ANAPL|nr:hypothetical protein Anapl_03260 [Anas platyrhynchos]